MILPHTFVWYPEVFLQLTLAALLTGLSCNLINVLFFSLIAPRLPRHVRKVWRDPEDPRSQFGVYAPPFLNTFLIACLALSLGDAIPQSGGRFTEYGAVMFVLLTWTATTLSSYINDYCTYRIAVVPIVSLLFSSLYTCIIMGLVISGFVYPLEPKLD